MSQEALLYSWSFDDRKNRSSNWYIIFLSVMLWIVVWGFLTKQYGMSFVIILVSGLMYFMENNADETINVEIFELGIKISDNFYDYSRIRSYGIIYEWEDAILLRLHLDKSSISQVDLNIDNNIAVDLNELLPNFLTEDGNTSLSFVEKMIRLLKL